MSAYSDQDARVLQALEQFRAALNEILAGQGSKLGEQLIVVARAIDDDAEDGLFVSHIGMPLSHVPKVLAAVAGQMNKTEPTMTRTIVMRRR